MLYVVTIIFTVQHLVSETLLYFLMFQIHVIVVKILTKNRLERLKILFMWMNVKYLNYIKQHNKKSDKCLFFKCLVLVCYRNYRYPGGRTSTSVPSQPPAIQKPSYKKEPYLQNKKKKVSKNTTTTTTTAQPQPNPPQPNPPHHRPTKTVLQKRTVSTK